MASEAKSGNQTETESKGISGVALAGLIIALISFVVFFISGFGYNWKIWSLGTAFQLLKYGAFGGIGGLVISIIGIVITSLRHNRTGIGISFVGIIAGLIVTATFGYFYHRATTAPPIHDITTDIENPPDFIALVPIRANAPNETIYPGGKTAKLQRENYPDIKPLYLDVSKEEAFNRALAAAKKMSWWKIQATDSSSGHIEATSTIPWFGFKDDIVVRVTADNTSGKSRIDVRSVSRLGKSDIGENARRIHKYMDEIRALTP